MSESIGLVKKTQQAGDGEGRDKIQQIKSLINTLYKGTTEKDDREHDEGGGGGGRNGGGDTGSGGGGGDGKEDRDQNSIRLIFSAIKNEFYNLANKNHQVMNVNRERIRTNETFMTLNLEATEKPDGNKTDYERAEVLLDDIILEPPADGGQNPFLSFLNNSLGPSEGARSFPNRTLDKDQSNFRNESLKSNFDFLASALYNFNAAEFFASGGATNLSNYESANSSGGLWNNTNYTSDWDPHGNGTWEPLVPMPGNYWALILIIFPFLTLFGNVLVILAVVRERALQTATNYFIVSLALADLLVAVLVMPFAVYVLVNGAWSLPAVVCDFYIAMDVTCSTSSIFNLVAISIDRVILRLLFALMSLSDVSRRHHDRLDEVRTPWYIAVTQPIKYAKHKNTQRVWSTIALVWVISAAIGSPIVLGLNNTPDRIPDLCLFYNSDFIIYSSLSSFYIPCIIMVFLYYNIFKALRNRARKARATRKPNAGEILPGSVIENVIQTRRLAETTLGEPVRAEGTISMEDERPTNTGSGSNEDEGAERSPGSDEIKGLSLCADECEVIPNDKSTEFILSTVVEEAAAVVSTTTQSLFNDPNGNNDSGYAASNLEDAHIGHLMSPHHSPPRRAHTVPQFKSNSGEESPIKGQRPSDPQSHGKDQKSSSIGSRFTIYKVNKASRKKREKSSAKKERKATKTLAIVLGVFLICWVPFFTCNILDALCTKLSQSCQPGVAAFILTTWLGYFNSFVNPVIYTIFNPEFRKAFKKIMSF